MLKIYNGLTRKKEDFQPIVDKHVKMYVCGITVYDRCHLGHARSMFCFDTVVRFLRAAGYTVTYVRNITDIDDKIIERALSRNISIEALTEENIKVMHEDTEALSLLAPDAEPRATEYMQQMIELITRLVEKGLAYVTESGDVCFEVGKFKLYGRLSHQDLEGLLAGARVEVMEEKRAPLDFVLWKKAKPNEPAWPSPWGEGRPGWHIECSAMSMGILGETFDIHGGGADLIFPHHENEIAQSEGATDKVFANYWMHAGLLHINQEKMAKSLGNFLTIEKVLAQYPAEVVRYLFIGSHYRSILHYSEEAMTQAHRALSRLYQALKDKPLGEKTDPAFEKAFFDAMYDDFNTPIALSVLFDIARELNKAPTPTLAATLKKLGGILGLLQHDPMQFLQTGKIPLATEAIEALIEERKKARVNKDWKRSDEIRDQLLAEGIVLEDSTEGTTWRAD